MSPLCYITDHVRESLQLITDTSLSNWGVGGGEGGERPPSISSFLNFCARSVTKSFGYYWSLFINPIRPEGGGEAFDARANFE